MKGLRAFGPAGHNGDQFNWCTPYEPVALDGFVCCSSAACGCNRGFVGQVTRKGTTLAVVSEITGPEQTEAIKALPLQDFPIGAVVRAECVGDEWKLELVNLINEFNFSSGVCAAAYTRDKGVYVVVQQEVNDDEFSSYTKILGFSDYVWAARDIAKITADELCKEYLRNGKSKNKVYSFDGNVIVKEGNNNGNRHPSTCLSSEFIVTTSDTDYVLATVWVQKLNTVFCPLFETLQIANGKPS
jgi:hypothetical protein